MQQVNIREYYGWAKFCKRSIIELYTAFQNKFSQVARNLGKYAPRAIAHYAVYTYPYPEVYSLYVFSSLNYSVVLKSNL